MAEGQHKQSDTTAGMSENKKNELESATTRAFERFMLPLALGAKR